MDTSCPNCGRSYKTKNHWYRKHLKVCNTPLKKKQSNALVEAKIDNLISEKNIGGDIKKTMTRPDNIAPARVVEEKNTLGDIEKTMTRPDNIAPVYPVDHKKIKNKLSLKVDLNTKGAKEPKRCSPDNIIEFIRTHKHVHEFFDGPVKPFFDIDYVFGDREDYDDFMEDGDFNDHLTHVRDTIAKAFDVDVGSVEIADRSGLSKKKNKWKCSQHVVVNDVKVEFIGHLISHCNVLAGDIKGLDSQPYKHKNLGMPYCTKMGDPRVMKRMVCDEYGDWHRQELDELDNDGYLRLLGQTVSNERIVKPLASYVEPPKRTLEHKDYPWSDKILKAIQTYLPDVEDIMAIHYDELKYTVELAKTEDECPICERVHGGNRHYAIYNEEKDFALLKCHSDDAKGKSKTLWSSPVEEAKEPEETEDSKKTTADDVNDILNNMFDCDEKWKVIKEGNKFKCVCLTSGLCLKDMETVHNEDSMHSALMVSKFNVVTTCMDHGKKKLSIKEFPHIRSLKESLGLKKTKMAKEDAKKSVEEVLQDYLREDGKSNSYKKEGENILTPVEGVPTYYAVHMPFNEYLNQLYSDRKHPTYKLYRKTARNHHKLMDYLKHYNDEEMPFIKRNHRLVSYRNGCLDLDTLEFRTFEEIGPTDVSSGIFIDQDFDTGVLDKKYKEIQTPLWDKLIRYHINDDMIYGIFTCMVGRLFFEVGERDNWQVMPFIRGKANTGKSTAFEIIKRMFNPATVGKIGKEKTFGLQNLHDSKVIIYPDIDGKLADMLPAADFQSMVSGETMSIAVKNKTAITKDWTTPQIWGGNFLPPYEDKAGSVTRRIATFDMNRDVKNKDATLMTKILQNELSDLIVKCVKAYGHYIDFFGNTTFEDWGRKFEIEYFDERMEQLKQETNYLYNFITGAPGANKTKRSDIWIEHDEKAITELEDFKRSFGAFMKFKHNINKYKWSSTSDVAILEKQGYKVQRINICASCGQKAHKLCCAGFSRQNRRRRFVIENMRIRNKATEQPHGYDSDSD